MKKKFKTKMKNSQVKGIQGQEKVVEKNPQLICGLRKANCEQQMHLSPLCFLQGELQRAYSRKMVSGPNFPCTHVDLIDCYV